MEHVKSRFDIVLTGSIRISFIHLHSYKYLLQPSKYLSLLVESLGTMRLAYHALDLHATSYDIPLPRLYIDTTGCAFTYLIPKCLVPQCRVMAYVHYPTISTDMLQLVYQRRPSYNHNVDIAKSVLITYLKLSYYCLFAMAYGIMGSLADLVLVNSTWTFRHICQLWGWVDKCQSYFFFGNNSRRQRIQILFPPCNVARLNHLPLNNDVPLSSSDSAPTPSGKLDASNMRRGRQSGWIVSIGQFRPEKDHRLQLRALALLLQQHPELKQPSSSSSSSESLIQLILIGSCRSGTEDEQRVAELRQLANELNVADHVVWILNQSTTVIVDDWLSQASIGIHSMWNEHFGIAIVEMMAAGLVMIAHNSGGPQTDIIGPFSSSTSCRNGFLASTVEEYAQVLYQVLTMSETKRLEIRKRARESVERFSDQVFVSSFQKALIQSGILKKEMPLEDPSSRKED